MSVAQSTGSAGPARILLVDDHALYREGLRAMLAREPGFLVVGEAADGREALLVAGQVPLDLALVDLSMPGVSGVSVTRELRRIQPRCRVLLLSMIDDPYRVAEALRAGASGFALKSQATAEIIEAVGAVLGGLRYLAPRLSRDEIDALTAGEAEGPLDKLSPREREVFDLLVRGYHNDAIAAQLFVAERTVETHRQHIMNKLGVHSVVELVRLAARHRLIAE